MDELSIVFRKPPSVKPPTHPNTFNTQLNVIGVEAVHHLPLLQFKSTPSLSSQISPSMSLNQLHRSLSLDQYLSSSSVPSLLTSQNIQYWSFGDQSSTDLSSCQGCPGVLPLASFNHISREVLDLEKSVKFYSLILGFQEIPRPSLDCKGCWLFGYGVSVHLIVTNCREKRLEVLRNRKEHFTTSLPTVDHIAFVTNDTTFVESVLIREKVFYRRFDPEGTNITQLFIFDPDGNVVEVSSCGIPIGDTKCSNRQVGNAIGAFSPNTLLENQDSGDSSPRYIPRPASMEDFLTSPKQNSVRYWSFGDQSSTDLSSCQGCPGVLPLASFNHISREVLDLEKSVKFYSLILGFQEIPRPSLDCKGCWLFGYGVSVHLIVTNCREKRLEVLRNRKEHFTTSLPTVDHIAFVTNDTTFVESVLIREKVFYRRFDPEGTNITQLFIFDPDGNVVEVSSCGIPIGDTKCSDHEKGNEIGAMAPIFADPDTLSESDFSLMTDYSADLFPVKHRPSCDSSIPEREGDDDEQWFSASGHDLLVFRRSFDHSELFVVQAPTESEDNGDCPLEF